MLVEAGLVDFSSACFEFAGEIPEEAQNGSLANLWNIISSHLHGPSKSATAGSVRRCPLAYSLCYHAALISASSGSSTFLNALDQREYKGEKTRAAVNNHAN